MISRSLRMLAQPLLRCRSNVKMLQPSRKKWVYREIPPNDAKWTFYAADGINAFLWWWIFVHFYYQSDRVFGEYDYPQPEKWTDAELGITDE